MKTSEELIKKHDESSVLTEGGIYPVELADNALNAFESKVNDLFDSFISTVKDLKLLPSINFVPAYWYKARILIDEDAIINFIYDHEELVPKLYKLLEENKLIIGSLSDICVEYSYDKKGYIDGIDLDVRDSEEDYKEVVAQSDIVGEHFINILYDAKDELIELLQQYEVIENDDEVLDESLNNKNNFNFLDDWYGQLEDIKNDFKSNGFDVLDINSEYAVVEDKDENQYEVKFGGTENTITIKNVDLIYDATNECANLNWDYENEKVTESENFENDEEDEDPKLGELVSNHEGWKVYKGTNLYGDVTFRCFLPEDDNPVVGWEDWETETLELAIEWIDNYDSDEDDFDYSIDEDDDDDEFEFENLNLIKENNDCDVIESKDEETVYKILGCQYDLKDNMFISEDKKEFIYKGKSLNDAYLYMLENYPEYSLGCAIVSESDPSTFLLNPFPDYFMDYYNTEDMEEVIKNEIKRFKNNVVESFEIDFPTKSDYEYSEEEIASMKNGFENIKSLTYITSLDDEMKKPSSIYTAIYGIQRQLDYINKIYKKFDK